MRPRRRSRDGSWRRSRGPGNQVPPSGGYRSRYRSLAGRSGRRAVGRAVACRAASVAVRHQDPRPRPGDRSVFAVPEPEHGPARPRRPRRRNARRPGRCSLGLRPRSTSSSPLRSSTITRRLAASTPRCGRWSSNPASPVDPPATSVAEAARALLISRTTNSAGFSGAKPITARTIPSSRSPCVIVVRSQRTKKAS